ncbi:MAG TPA: trehalose-phosphatase [Thermoanaerobaculia bacterium]|nr:trehalose-phosphatase [Thermoanaerobaculia bacterium]
MAAPGSRDLPSALARWPEIARRLAGRRLALFLDFDGTLSPIVATPALATLPEPTREVLRRLVRRLPLAFLSGREREDVAGLVGLPAAIYAGNHGFDIAGPPAAGGGGEGALRHEVGDGDPGRLERLAERLRRDLAGIRGALVEPKRFSVAVHYRLVGDEDLPRVEAAVDRAVAELTAASAASAAARSEKPAGAARPPALVKTHSKKVFELRPDIDWHKGRALEWLLERLNLAGGEARLPLFIGDDVTDEDAFAAVAGRGLGILVADEPRATAATYRLRDPGEVRQFLEHLADLADSAPG